MPRPITSFRATPRTTMTKDPPIFRSTRNSRITSFVGAGSYCQRVPFGAGGAGLRAPERDYLCRGYLLIGEDPADSEFAAAVAAKSFEASRFARDHLFEDRAPLWSRHASPNVPSDMSMAAPPNTCTHPLPRMRG
jgi:hypothetical protein